MKKKNYLTFRYILKRIGVYIYWKLNPDLPWLTKKANNYLDANLNDSMLGFEFGSGRSSIWFANKLKKLISVEGHKGWYEKVSSKFSKENVTNIDYIFSEFDEKTEIDAVAYSNIICTYDDEYFDFILVDGGPRDLCALNSIEKLKRGGMLVIDNLNWYLPSDSLSPHSRSIKDGCSNENWKKVYGQISQWESIWTSSGVTDTGIFIKP